jgi:hypothetical protein
LNTAWSLLFNMDPLLRINHFFFNTTNHPNMAQMNDGNAKQMILASEFASKAKSKREIFVFLCTNVMAYLPDYDTVTIYYLKDLISGKKKCK